MAANDHTTDAADDLAEVLQGLLEAADASHVPALPVDLGVEGEALVSFLPTGAVVLKLRSAFGIGTVTVTLGADEALALGRVLTAAGGVTAEAWRRGDAAAAAVANAFRQPL